MTDAPPFALVDPSCSPPTVAIPRHYNAALDFVDRHVLEGRGAKVAFIHDRGRTTYGELAAQVARAGHALRARGVRQETRVALCLTDTIDFPIVFWGAVKIGAIPVPLNTLLTPQEYAYMLHDSRARALVVSADLYPKIAPALEGLTGLDAVLVAGAGDAHGHARLDDALAEQSVHLLAAQTTCDDIAFWLYSSGSTGAPKGTMHLQSSLVHTAALYGRGILAIEESDVIFSAAKLFFAYGLGNGMTFPMHVGATTVLLADRPTPASVRAVLREHTPTLFGGVPTLFAAILADPALDPSAEGNRLRACISAGEALPADIGERWRARFGVDILDGLGSTEMLHIFLSNRFDDVRFGTSGKPVPGYEVRVVDDAGHDVRAGDLGELLVNGPSAAAGYWNQRQRTLATFHGPWTRTGDKYFVDEDGYFHYAGRADDMLKVSGIWVSPFEVESCLIAHADVLEAAVVACEDGDRLVKPKAFVVLREGITGSRELELELKTWVKTRLAPHKYPRWVEFVAALPKTATGKIQRFKLRGPVPKT
ncbi:MAG TPA: benzoate-CoA ligase family protein [Polyangiaceae bacterium]|nr:benzoate-CoA ligase family protein [Polyangiaceae bacterium]